MSDIMLHLMLGEYDRDEGSESRGHVGQEPASHAADIAAAHSMLSGDEPCWTSFLAAIRLKISTTAIGWCRQSGAGGSCAHCSPTRHSTCDILPTLEPAIEGWIRQFAMKAYRGQTTLAVFIECLLNSKWWYWDYFRAPLEDLPIYKKPTATDGYQEDLVHAWAVLAESKSAWMVFLRAFNDEIESTATSWCHRSIRSRVCLRCKPNATDADYGCDAFGDAYTYILHRLRFTALASYGGRTALGNFVNLCLRDHRWWNSFVQKETRNKVRVPKALENEPELIQNIHRRLIWGWGRERIAAEMKVPIDEVEEAWTRIEKKLRDAGQTISPRKIETVSLSEPYSDDDDGRLKVPEPRSTTISPEIRAEALHFWVRLPIRDRVILRLHVDSKLSVAEIAKRLEISSAAVYATIYRVRDEMPEWFKNGK